MWVCGAKRQHPSTGVATAVRPKERKAATFAIPTSNFYFFSVFEEASGDSACVKCHLLAGGYGEGFHFPV